MCFIIYSVATDSGIRHTQQVSLNINIVFIPRILNLVSTSTRALSTGI